MHGWMLGERVLPEPTSQLMSRPSFPARLPSGMPQTGAKPAQSPTAPSQAPSKPVTVATKNIAASAHSVRATAPKSIQKTPFKPPAVPASVGMDSHAVRARMVQKLAEGGVQDQAVLAAMNAIERHRFVDTALAGQAYEDTSLPIGLSQTISKPNVVARMIELLRQGCALDAQGKMGRVLEIGSGCGYQAAVLARLSSEVYSIERLRGLYDKALVNIRHLSAPGLHLLLGDGMLGYAKGAPYAGIIAAAGGKAIPQAWIDQLAVGGRIVAPMGDGAAQSLMVIDKTAQGLKQTVLESVLFVPLKSGVV
jgi:protein-L-isoaspartate(D-aspartate) O-methyltransferase